MKRYEAITIRFYNRVTGSSVDKIEQIPDAARDALSFISYNNLARPFVIEDLEAGHTPKQVSITYQIPRGTIRSMGEKYCILPRKEAKTRQEKSGPPCK